MVVCHLTTREMPGHRSLGREHRRGGTVDIANAGSRQPVPSAAVSLRNHPGSFRGHPSRPRGGSHACLRARRIERRAERPDWTWGDDL